MALVLVTPPDFSPLMLEAESHLRTDSGAADYSVVARAVGAAGSYAQEFTRRGIGAQVFELTLEAFPLDAIELPYPPLISVEAVTYTDPAGMVQTLDPATYVVDQEGARIFPAYGTRFPSTRPVPNAVRVRFRCGYPVASIPDAIRSAMLLVAGDLYENREAQSASALYRNKTADLLLWPFRAF